MDRLGPCLRTCLADVSRTLGRNVDSSSRHAAGGRLMVVRWQWLESSLPVTTRCARHRRYLADLNRSALGLRIRRSDADASRVDSANTGPASRGQVLPPI